MHLYNGNVTHVTTKCHTRNHKMSQNTTKVTCVTMFSALLINDNN